jgi:hypothetical protein
MSSLRNILQTVFAGLVQSLTLLICFPVANPSVAESSMPSAVLSYTGADSSFSHQSGFRSGTAWATDTNQPRDSYIVFGPYTKALTSANYVARFILSIDNNAADDASIVAVDINDAAHKNLMMSLDIRRTDFVSENAPVAFDVPFYSPPGAALEFRVYYHCCASIQVSQVLVFPNQTKLPLTLNDAARRPAASSYPVPDKSQMIGVSETFSHNASKWVYQNIKGLPTNTVYRPLPDEALWIRDLAVNHHVRLFRDIFPVAMLAGKAAEDQSYWGQLVQTIDVFRSLNVRLVLDFSYPLPEWMIPPEDSNSTCKAVMDLGRWPQLKNSMSWAIGGFVAAMAQDPSRMAWMRLNLFLEPLNEVDNEKCGLTPAQAADLYNGIVYVLGKYGVEVQILSPSFVNNKPSFVSAYYAAGGGGLPNVHIYTPHNSTPDSTIHFLRAQLGKYQAAVPREMRTRFFMTETGVALSTADDQPHSNTSGAVMNEADRNVLYQEIINDPTINQSTEAVVFWRLYDLPQTPGLYGAPEIKGIEGEGYYGIVDSRGSAYTSVAQSIFDGIRDLEVRGTYSDSCDSCSFDRSALSCACHNGRGGKIRAILDLSTCAAVDRVWNNNGALACQQNPRATQ